MDRARDPRYGAVRLCLALAAAFVGSLAAGGCVAGGDSSCFVGSLGCECTPGGACDPGLTCSGGVCDRAFGGGGSGAGAAANGGSSGSGGAGQGGGAAAAGGSGGTEPGTGGASPAPIQSCELVSGSLDARKIDSLGLCTEAVASVSVSVNSERLVEMVDGQPCTPVEVGHDCTRTFPDKYECGGCTFEVREGGSTREAWLETDCIGDPCAKFCCAIPGTTTVDSASYELPRGGGSGGSGGGGNGGTGGSRPPCGSCMGCYQKCNIDCLNYPEPCTGPCYQGCDTCCSL